MDSLGDWSIHKDYVEMLQQDEAEGFVIATGVQYSVRDSVACYRVTIPRQDACVDEAETDQNGNMMIKVDSRHFRPIEVETLLGNSTKAKEKLSWPLTISLYEFVAEKRGDFYTLIIWLMLVFF